jgi:hypothetical protein
MIQLTRNGMTGAVDIDALREEYRSLNTFRMRQLIHPDLMQYLSRRLEETSWKIRKHEKIGIELVPDDGIPESILYFVANLPAFLNVIRRITECDEIAGYGGRIYRFADPGQYDSWHDDVSGSSRLVGMSVNLSPEPYEGGLFRIRRRGSAEIIRELPNTIPGDAIFFRISTDLQHIVTPVEGIPKTAFAGWFGAAFGFREL